MISLRLNLFPGFKVWSPVIRCTKPPKSERLSQMTIWKRSRVTWIWRKVKGVVSWPAESMSKYGAGELGPSILVRGRPAVLRETFLQHLGRLANAPADREVAP